jgi:NADH-quinone oxidoreductase subunit M
MGIATTVFASGGTVEFPLLSALILIPAVGAVLIALLPRSRPEVFRQIAMLLSVATGAISIWLLAAFDSGASDFQFRSEQSWVSELGISWLLGVDGISLFLIVLTGILFPIAIMAEEPDRDPKQYFAWLLLLEAGCMGVFMALDLVMFFIFFEIVLVPMYFLIGRWGHGNRVFAATKFFLYTMAGSALMLVGIVTLAVLDASRGGHDLSFSLEVLANSQALAESSAWTARFVFLSFALAFAVKVPIFPLHTWLPDAHTEAPTAGSVILAGVMLKLGTYGFLRFGLYLFPDASVYFAPMFIALGVVGILYGAIVATMQRDLKRLVAYSSVAHLGFIVMGTFALNSEGITGGLLQMINHGVSTGALFLLVGMIYQRRHTRMIDELGGLQKAAPIMAGVFMLVMLSSIGLPGLNGFVGEYLTLLGTFLAHRWWAVVATAGVILAALYMLWAYQRVFHGPAEGENAEMPDLRFSEGLLLLPLIGLILFMGIYPKPVIERMEPAVDALIVHIEEHVDDFTEPTNEVLVATAPGHGEETADGEGAHE